MGKDGVYGGDRHVKGGSVVHGEEVEGELWF